MFNPVLPLPPLEVIAKYFPQFALALWDGVELRPNLRTLEANFSTTTINTQLDASFDEQISSFSLFGGAAEVIDPTGNLNGNPLKSMSDRAQARVSGIVVNFTVRGRGDDYSPVPTDTPLELVPAVLNPTVGLWAWDNPDNVRARFTINGFVPAAPFTVWLVFGFYQLASRGCDFLRLDRQCARDKLIKCGVICPCPPAGALVVAGAG
ncbi:MAG TPA: hypothetical protein VK989_00665 [Polyangia bacterium]|jgi:hypothetical protein|nr:hypothetical protein [Polyangia bacterium]